MLIYATFLAISTQRQQQESIVSTITEFSSLVEACSDHQSRKKLIYCVQSTKAEMTVSANNQGKSRVSHKPDNAGIQRIATFYHFGNHIILHFKHVPEVVGDMFCCLGVPDQNTAAAQDKQPDPKHLYIYI